MANIRPGTDSVVDSLFFVASIACFVGSVFVSFLRSPVAQWWDV